MAREFASLFSVGEKVWVYSASGFQLNAEPAAVKEVFPPINGEHYYLVDLPGSQTGFPESWLKKVEEHPLPDQANAEQLLRSDDVDQNIVASSLITWGDLNKSIDPITWAWPGWLPNGFLTMIVSESGAGKSNLLLRVFGTFILGMPWPDGSMFEGEVGGVLWCEAEGAQVLNLERAKSWGYPLERFFVPHKDPLQDFNFNDTSHRKALEEKIVLPEVKFAVFDSLRGMHIGDENSSGEMIRVVKWLSNLAKKSGKPIVVSHHLNKGLFSGSNGISLNQIRGSTANVQIPRSVWALDTPDMQNKDRKRLSIIKSNLCRFSNPIGLRITEEGVVVGDAPASPITKTQTEKGCELLVELLKDGPKKQSDVEIELMKHTISKRTIHAIKKKIGCISKKVGGSNGYWEWSLPI